MEKTGTNNFRCKSLITGQITIMPGDQLIKINTLDEDKLLQLCREMERTAAKEALGTAPSTLAGNA